MLRTGDKIYAISVAQKCCEDFTMKCVVYIAKIKVYFITYTFLLLSCCFGRYYSKNKKPPGDFRTDSLVNRDLENTKCCF